MIIQTFDGQSAKCIGLGPGLKDDPETESVGKRSWGFMPPVQFRDGKRSREIRNGLDLS